MTHKPSGGKRVDAHWIAGGQWECYRQSWFSLACGKIVDPASHLVLTFQPAWRRYATRSSTAGCDTVVHVLGMIWRSSESIQSVTSKSMATKVDGL